MVAVHGRRYHEYPLHPPYPLATFPQTSSSFSRGVGVGRRRRREMRPSLIDVDDTYIIDGEGQPAILALSAQVSVFYLILFFLYVICFRWLWRRDSCFVFDSYHTVYSFAVKAVRVCSFCFCFCFLRFLLLQY